MKAELVGNPESGTEQRVLISPGATELILETPMGVTAFLEPIIKVYGIEAIGMPYVQTPETRDWCRANNASLIEWAKPEWMENGVALLRATIIVCRVDEHEYIASAQLANIACVVADHG